MSIDYEVFKGKNLAGLFKDIYNNSKKNKKIIQALVSELSTYIKTTDDALVIIPSIREFLEVDVKNDEQLVKLAKVVQQLSSNERFTNENENISKSDRQDILDTLRKSAAKEASELDKSNNNIKSQIDKITQNVQTPEA